MDLIMNFSIIVAQPVKIETTHFGGDFSTTFAVCVDFSGSKLLSGIFQFFIGPLIL